MAAKTKVHRAIKAVLVISGASDEDLQKIVKAAERAAEKTSKARITEFS